MVTAAPRLDEAIRILTEPAVYVVGKQSIDDAELSRFLGDHGVSWESDSEVAGEVLTETAGRVCYMSFAKPRPGGNHAYLNHIKEVGHGSVLEHAVWNFVITGISRTLTHELVRHRAGMSYSQLSQRYVDESVAEYVEPDIIANDPELHAIWLESVRHSHAAYVKLAEKLNAKLADPAAAAAAMLPPDADRTTRRKTARQAARSVLPNATETKIFVTANARALRHFLEQRGSAFAEPEIRKLAGAFLEILQKDSPNLFGDYVRVPLPDGTFEVTTPYKKV
ncbi:fad-dependent thymidylate synthase : Thymidylate synthase ThyX OS=Saccharomonospora viridis (strain ATCC 15386 / DSM 43017 / JCM 3036 / NBRC 12207 / P101) GN=thyX PE=3 SV=1: Thy1 [Gemmataceae bacterium]|nr:fad-dependent thymidylate synthase : Thymidylate synthase ThyX OS=Saccharomonospora viridis (strain ATCC 15386 / DSM 43017 / JCM 3036 / NBRC 12207 / P101) GN=thyX PE=3 SV=1: Thy1 [Gemmataceae bacterium]VTT99085.1 fad-dependent thymidylate synthase : Thymidylate synthase ThyX OS=Saccharomonospora viridis (strain ATCC 15386 / DSM 43017 / JCM 3036 / NBRC 12207 / P101) GN=thyX PE=3 SV=1: Thy1 [Gemmataceae bacterium]